MLLDCVSSLSNLTPIEGVAAEIIVIDNEPEGSEQARETAQRFDARYIHQPDRGIPQARNAALDAARGIGATHLAFIDDDETAAPDWLAQLWAAMVKFEAGAVQGLVRYVYPEEAQAWRRRDEGKGRKSKTGDVLELVATNNVLFRLNAADYLRFDETLGLIGGEDVVFFNQIAKRGGKLVFCREAITTEKVPMERTTIRATLWKAYCSGSGRIYEGRIMERPPSHITPLKLTKRLLSGLARVLVSPFCFALGVNAGLRAFTSGTRQIAFLAGVIAGLSRLRRPEYYERPTGY